MHIWCVKQYNDMYNGSWPQFGNVQDCLVKLGIIHVAMIGLTKQKHDAYQRNMHFKV